MITIMRLGWIAWLCPRLTTAALVLASLLMSVVVATQSTQAQTFTTIYAFNGNDGRQPEAGLIQDSSGNLYGTTELGGSSRGGDGVVFKLDPTGQESVLYRFGPLGAFPMAGVVEDGAGNFYGTTNRGGRSRLGT
jgi:uncharacterized repeat protein (TIGR03803 family)